MKLADALRLDALDETQVVAGRGGLTRELRGVSTVDIPDPLPWVQSHHLLLTTGYAWPRDDEAIRRLVRRLDGQQIAGIGMAVPQFFESFPVAAIAAAEEFDLPLLEVPWEIPFAHVSAVIHRALLAEHLETLEKTERIHRELTEAAIEADSLQQIVDRLGRFLDRDITLEDPEGRLLAHFSPVGAGQATKGTDDEGSVPRTSLAALQQTGRLGDLRASKGPLFLPALPELGLGPRVVCPITIKRRLVGLVWILQGDLPFNELDLRAAEQAATIAALHLAHQKSIVQQEMRLGFSFLEALIEGHFEASATNLERARLFGFDVNGTYMVAIFVLHVSMPLSPSGFAYREEVAERLRRRMADLGFQPLVSINLDRVIALVPADQSIEALLPGLPAEEISILLGRPHVGFEGVRRSYKEGLSILEHAELGKVLRYADWLVPRVLMGDSEAQDVLLAVYLGPLARIRNGASLRATLEAWVRTGFLHTETALRLKIHRNTLKYRLERIAALLGKDLDDPEIRFELRLATELFVHRAQTREPI
jgi:purine catabolism regulator